MMDKDIRCDDKDPENRILKDIDKFDAHVLTYKHLLNVLCYIWYSQALLGDYSQIVEWSQTQGSLFLCTEELREKRELEINNII